jgi:hypothetical protein
MKLFLRTGEPETARWCSEAIGSREVIRPIESETAGPEDLRDAISVSYQRKEESLVLASEIQQLPSLQGYLNVSGFDVAAVTFPVQAGESKHPAFIPRPASHASDQTASSPVAPVPAVPVPAAPPRLLVMKPLPARAGEENARAATVASTPVTTDDGSTTHQLDLFPVEQKRRR